MFVTGVKGMSDVIKDSMIELFRVVTSMLPM